MQSQTVDIKVDIRVLRDNRSNSAVRAHAEETGSCYWPKKSDVCKEVKIHSNFHQPPQIHSKLKANESSCGESSAAWTLILFFFFFAVFPSYKGVRKKTKNKTHTSMAQHFSMCLLSGNCAVSWSNHMAAFPPLLFLCHCFHNHNMTGISNPRQWPLINTY